MRYLKTYEKITNKKLLELNKYLVFQSDDINNRLETQKFYILELLNIKQYKDVYDDITVKKLFTYENNNITKYEYEKPFDVNLNNRLIKIIYDSNDINDCFDYIRMISNVKKYNL